MKLFRILGVSSALCLSAATLSAQGKNEIEQLKAQLRQMQEDFEKVRRQQEDQIRALTERLDALSKSQPAANLDTAKTDEQKKLEEQLAAELAQPSANIATNEQKGWRPTAPIRIGKGGAFMDVGLVGTFAAGGSTANDVTQLQLGGHDPNQNGFTVQGVEATFSGAVDPFFRANANVLFSVDAEGESFLELEEAWMQSVSLPGNLQLRAGQILTEFGRQNTQHPHSWNFVDSPLVNARLLGPDGLRNPGARLSWLVPTPFYSELFLSLQDSHGETAASFRGGGDHHGDEGGLPLAFRHPENDRGVNNINDLLITPRFATSFELTDTQTILLGASAAFGPNASGSSGETKTQIYGTDLMWKWKSPKAEAGFPFVTWQTEALFRRYRAGAFDWDENGNGGDNDGNGFPDDGVLADARTGLPAAFSSETLNDYGFYTQLSYGFKKGWVAGLRFDYLTGDRGSYESIPLIISDNAGGGMAVGRDLVRGERWRISPNLTWYPSEFSKLRLQYNYDDRRDIGVDHSIWLQFEFILGAHAAHKF